jgi:protein-disulfide isomerase
VNDNLPESGADGAAAADAPLPPVTTDVHAPTAPAPAADDVAPVPVLEPVRPLDGPAVAPPATQRRNIVAIIGTVALVVVLAFGGGFAAGRVSAPASDATASDGPAAVASQAPEGSSVPSAEPSPEPEPTPTPDITPVPSEGPDLPSDGARLGRADAPVLIDYWADYQCPFCSKFAQEVIPALAPYIEDGTVQLVHRDFAFIGPESTQAAIAVRCAEREGKYWWMHDAVYAAQDGENQGAYADPKLVAIAESIGLDTAAFETCLADHDVLVEVLDDTAAGNRVGIESTPTMDINGVRLLGVPKFADVEAAIAAAVAGATPAPLPTQRPTGDPWEALDTGTREAGPSAAPVTVELWMDYQATDSKAIAEALEPELRKRAEAGRVRLVQKDLALLGEESVTASSAVRCTADQRGPAWLLHDILSVNAQGGGSGIYTTDVMLRIASQLGLDVKRFDTCLASPGIAEAVRLETEDGKALGLQKGPAVVVRKDGKEIARFTDAIDATAVIAAIDGTD